MHSFVDELKDRLGTKSLTSLDGSTIVGGCISQAKAYKLEDGSQIFVKRNKGQDARLMFDGELESLKSIQLTNTIRCPKPIMVVEDPSQDLACAIVMEYINMGSLNNDNGFTLGQKLAELHKYNDEATKHEQRLSKWVGRKIPVDRDATKLDNLSLEDEIVAKAYNLETREAQKGKGEFIEDLPLKAQDKFGYHVPTCCGALPQVNEWCDDWVVFFARHRLHHQIQMLEQHYGDRELSENWSKLQVKIEKFFKEFNEPEHRIRPALLHGDLWSGNIGVDLASDNNKDVVIYDPSSFYGHHEYEFGIAAMFGGIPQTFYDGYFTKYRKGKNFDKRIKLYQLFHHLNHWNHFGRGYRSSTISLMKQLNEMTL